MREHGRILEEDIRAQVRAEARELGYNPDATDDGERQAYLLLLATMEKYLMTVAEADAYLEDLFARQTGPVADVVPIEWGRRDQG